MIQSDLYSNIQEISSKGYVKGNIWVISHLANMMKNSADKAELLKFAEWVILEHNSNKTNDLVLT